MVQVDIFWSYAIGAGFGTAAAAVAGAGRAAVQAGQRVAVGAGRAAEADRPDPAGGAGAGHRPDGPGGGLLADRRFTATVLFLACVFAPSGIWLVWQFTGWETMHAATGPGDLPGALVAAFALTNVTQGVLGYLVARALWRRGRRYLSWLQMPLGYLAMFFVLAYGWDGTGYQRFFSPTPAAWRAGAWDPLTFLSSDVALTLYGMGVVLVPSMLWLQSTWWTQAAQNMGAQARDAGRGRYTGLILATIFGLGLAPAVIATVLLLALGPLIGAACCGVLLIIMLHPRGAGGALARAFPFVSTTERTEAPPSR